MAKTYVLDTNVLLHDPTALFKFEDNALVVPIFVLEEIDNFKTEMTERGRSARHVARTIDELRAGGSLAEGVPLPNGGTLRVYVPPEGTPRERNADQDIIQTVVTLKKRAPDEPIIFVTMDVNLRVRGDALQLDVEAYENKSVDLDTLYTGVIDIASTEADVDKLYKVGKIPIEEGGDLYPNACVMLKGPNQSALGKYLGGHAHRLKLDDKHGPCGLRALNREQAFAMDLLMDPEVSLVTIVGHAGTGKTLMALAAGLDQLHNRYDKLLISRPIMPMGKDLGFLPGDISEKMDPWMKPLMDNMDYLCMAKKMKSGDLDRYFEEGVIQVEPLTYIRGRSLPGQFVLIDECFPYNTPVVTEDGPRKIGALFSSWVRGNTLPRVQSFDQKSETFVWKNVTQMWHRGKRDLVEVHASNRKLKCTPEHPFLTARGWIKAQDLIQGDFLVASHPEESQVLQVLSSDQTQVLLGSLLGDGSIDTFGPSRVRLSINHGRHQRSYCDWKAQVFHVTTKDILGAGYNPHEVKVGFTTKAYAYSDELPRPKTNCPGDVLASLNEKGLAIWFMDDGSAYTARNGATFHTESFDEPSLKMMQATLLKLGVKVTVCSYAKGPILRLNKEAYHSLCRLIAPWVHPSMSYKVHKDYHNLIGTGIWETPKKVWGYVVVNKVTPVQAPPCHVFDMEVEETHNFLVPSTSRGIAGGEGAMVVHNCQNLSPHEVKTIITRAGEGTKIVLTGDPHQIDNPYVDATSNGLSVTANLMREVDITGHITLLKGERSKLADIASKLL